MRRLLCLLLPIVFLAAPAAAQDVAVTVTEYGIFAVTVTGQINAPEDVAQERNLITDIALEQETRDIPAIPGRSFGYRFRVSAPAGTRLTLRTTFPAEGLTNPDTGRTVKTQDRVMTVGAAGEVYYDGYRFDRSWEMAEGVWVFQIVHQGRVLSEQRFRIHVLVN